MSAQGTHRFYSVQRQTILLVNGEPLGRETVNKKVNKSKEKLYSLQACAKIISKDTAFRC